MVGEQDETPMEGYGLTDTDMRGATRTNRVRGNPMRGPPLDPTMSPQQKEKYLSGSESPQEKMDRVNLLLQALKRINPDTMLRMDIEKADSGDPFSKAWLVLKDAYHPAIHGLMRRKKIADEFNEGVMDEFTPSDFVDEAQDDYEPKGAAERDPNNPSTLGAMERSGEISRQSKPSVEEMMRRLLQDPSNTMKMGGPMRQLDANPADPQRDMAMQNDMESFYDEAHKEVDDHHKKRQGKRKKLDEMAHRNDKKKVDDWYQQNHPEWFKTFDKE